MKKILFVYPKRFLQNQNANLHTRWPEHLTDEYEVRWFNPGLDQKTFEATIEEFAPDYIYMTIRNRYSGIRVNTKTVKVPSVYVECDAWNYKPTDGWYKRFDYLYTRTHWHVKQEWLSVPLLRWSIPEQKIIHVDPVSRTQGIGFIGTATGKYYPTRAEIQKRFRSKITFGNITKPEVYWRNLRKYSALICPTESIRGNFLPAKFFEFLAAGVAVITNADLDLFGVPEFKDKVIKYTGLDDLEKKLTMDFSNYYECAFDVLRSNYTDRIRYRSVFK